LKVPSNVRLAWILRGVFGFAGNISFTFAVRLIPLAKVTVIHYTNPIFIAVLGFFIVKEKPSISDLIGIGTTFTGVLVFMMNNQTETDTDLQNDIFGSIMALSCAIFTAAAMISIKKVGGKTHVLMLALSWSISNTMLSPLLTLT
jgi:drug/metabolite transporter (DMT)-like permease